MITEETESVELMNAYALEQSKEIRRLTDELLVARAKLAVATDVNAELNKKLATEEKDPEGGNPELLLETRNT